MKIRAKIPFAGAVVMAPGEIKDVPDVLATEYISIGYAEPVDDFSDKMNAPVEALEPQDEPEKKPAKKRTVKKKSEDLI